MTQEIGIRLHQKWGSDKKTATDSTENTETGRADEKRESTASFGGFRGFNGYQLDWFYCSSSTFQ
jgi:hypothetical protein